MTQLDLGQAQKYMKMYYDQRAKYRCFAPGDEMLLPIQRQPLAAPYSNPYVVKRHVGELDYLVATLDWRKQARLCHYDMLKPYYRKNSQKGT